MRRSETADDRDALPRRRRAVVILNPVAGPRRKGRIEGVLSLLRQYCEQVHVEMTCAPGDATRLAQQVDPSACDIIVAAGGDGTINEVANGMIGSPLPLAIIPLGTANVLAAEIGLSQDPKKIVETILHGRAVTVHPGLANGRYFLLMAGVGFDAEVVAAVTAQQKRWLGKAAYVLQSLALLLRYRYPRFRVTIDGESREAYSVIIVKGRYYAGHHLCAPDGDLGKAGFQVCLFDKAGPFAVLGYGSALLLGILPQHPHVSLVQGRTITVESSGRAPFQGDGDSFGTLPLAIALASKTLSIAMPAGR